jgi:hypothetical protein
LACSTVGATAHSEDVAADGFTGRWWVPACGQGDVFENFDEVLRFRGFRCEGSMGSSDPRFAGTYVSVANIDTYRGEGYAPPDGAFNVWTISRRVENEDGAWQGEATTAAWADGPETEVFIVDPPETMVFIGERGYDGLTAVVEFAPRVLNSHVRGFIFEGLPPPAPSLAE